MSWVQIPMVFTEAKRDNNRKKQNTCQRQSSCAAQDDHFLFALLQVRDVYEVGCKKCEEASQRALRFVVCTCQIAGCARRSSGVFCIAWTCFHALYFFSSGIYISLGGI